MSGLAELLTQAGIEVSDAQVDQVAKAVDDHTKFAEGLAGMVTRLGGTGAALADLYHQTYRHRDKQREQKDQIDALSGQVSTLTTQLEEAQRAVSETALSEADKELLAKAKKLGDLDALEARAAGAEQKLQGLERDGRRRKAAEVAGYRPDVLAGIAGMDAVDYEIGTVKVDGQDVPAAFVVVPAAEQGKEPMRTLLTEYVEAKHAAFIPALTTEAKPGGQPAPAHPTQKKTPAHSQNGAKTLQDRIIADVGKQYAASPEDRRAALDKRLGRSPTAA